VFPGIGCQPWTLHYAQQAFVDAGVTADIRFCQWKTPFYQLFDHLQDYVTNRDHAQRIADDIASYRRQRPEVPVDLVGYSAGGGIAVFVAELLPDDVRLRNVVLVQAAVSPTYDLTGALAHVDGKLVNLHSPFDWVILGWGTETFGTVDRDYGAAAGKDGFKLTEAVPTPALRTKVVQEAWSPDTFWQTGHTGGHAGLFGYLWNKKRVAPWLRP
jgi:pimeloyl-ACP methyl ester carboxylesterase